MSRRNNNRTRTHEINGSRALLRVLAARGRKLGDELPPADGRVHRRSPFDKAGAPTRSVAAFITILRKMATSILIHCVRWEGSHFESKCLLPLTKDPSTYAKHDQFHGHGLSLHLTFHINTAPKAHRSLDRLP